MSEGTGKTGRGRAYGMVAAAIIVVVVVVTVVARSGSRGEPENTGPAMTTVHIVCNPEGAQVVREDDGGLVGVTPFFITTPRSDTPLAVVVKHEGFQSRHSTIPLIAETGRIDVELIANGAKEPPPPKPLPRSEDQTP